MERAKECTVPGSSDSILCQTKKLHSVAADHLIFFRFWHAGEVSLYHPHGCGPAGFLVGKIRAPDETIDIDLVAQLNADSIELKSPQTMLADVLARQTAQRFETEQALRPSDVPVIAHVRRLQEKGNPADLIFGEEDPQVGKAVQQTRQDPLNRGYRTVSPDRSKTSHLVHQIVTEFFH